MFVNYFTVTIPSNFYDIAIKELAKEFGVNIPKYLTYDGGKYGFITNLFCVNVNVNIEQICKNHNYKIGNPYKTQIMDIMYNNNYTIHTGYQIGRPMFYLQLQ